MKASELRIGNWVQLHGHTVQIDIISTYEPDSILLSKCSPIPLTSEWLKQLGFIYHDGNAKCWSKSWGRNGTEIITFSEVYDRFCFQASQSKDIVLEHVHDLQNLWFIWTGEELTLK